MMDRRGISTYRIFPNYFLINVMKAPVMTKMLITWLNVEVSTNILCDKAVWAAKFKLC